MEITDYVEVPFAEEYGDFWEVCQVILIRDNFSTLQGEGCDEIFFVWLYKFGDWLVFICFDVQLFLLSLLEYFLLIHAQPLFYVLFSSEPIRIPK